MGQRYNRTNGERACRRSGPAFAAVISLSFPLIAEQSGANAFAFYAVCMIGQLLWVIFKMPETKGVPLETIQKQLGID